jgi:N-acyl-L-homoserine lactone synthetase
LGSNTVVDPMEMRFAMDNGNNIMVSPDVSAPEALQVLVRWEISDIGPDGQSRSYVAEAGIPLTEAARQACYRLRFLLLSQRFPMDRKYPNGLVIDDYDAHSHLFLARIGQEVIGTTRLIPCECGFPMENEKEVVLPNGDYWTFPDTHPATGVPIRRDETVEVSRFVGHPYLLPSGNAIWTTFLLIDAANNIYPRQIFLRKYVVALLLARQYDQLQQLGYDWTPIGERQSFRGAMTQAGFCDVMERNCPRIFPKNLLKRK